MATSWGVSGIGWGMTLVGWWLSPIIGLLLTKILSYLGFDASQKLRELKISTIPELKQTLRKVEEQRMLRAAKGDAPDDMKTMDMLAGMLRHAQYETEDILDLVGYHQMEKKHVASDGEPHGSSWLYGAAATCIDRCNIRSGSAQLQRWAHKSLGWFLRRLADTLLVSAAPADEPVPVTSAAAADEPGQVTSAAPVDEPVPVTSAPSESSGQCTFEPHGSIRLQRRLFGAVATCIDRCNIRSGSARLLQWAHKCLGWFLHRSDDILPVSAAPADEPVLPVTSAAPSDEPPPVASAAPSDSSGQWLCSFDFVINCCRSVLNWLTYAYEVVRYHRNLSYEMVGIRSYQENAAAASDSVLPAISRWDLKKRIEKVESTVSEVKKSPLLDVASKSSSNDIVNMNRRKIRSASSKREVFGREVLRDDIMAKLRETPHVDPLSSGTSACYSVIGIYGVAGSGKTTLARYVLDYIKNEYNYKLFDTIMCIHVSETFSVDDIFHGMLKDIINDRHSTISGREELKKTLEEKLRGKRFLLVLDDLWVKDNNDQELKELLSPLNVGMEGSKILATARRQDAVGVLGAYESIAISDLDEEQYFSMFMHYALGGTSVADEKFTSVGRKIAKKLHGSPIAAVTVAARLQRNPNIKFWERTERLDVLNRTRGALWWSYLQLDVDIRRCFEFCNIFPRRFKLRRDELVRLWIAHGFVKTSCATDMEDVAEEYVQELLSCSFLQPEGTSVDTDYFTIHDLLHDLADKVAGSDCFRIENGWSQRGEGWKGDVPRDVRHLFVQSYDGELITEKILKLENLRTLIIYTVYFGIPVEEKVFESIFRRLPKLRVLAVALRRETYEYTKKPDRFSVPESISQLKHLRYLVFRTSSSCRVILPSALTKLYHMQLLDFGHCGELEFSFGNLINLRHVFSPHHGNLISNIGRLTSLQTFKPLFMVKQLRNLNKLRKRLWIHGLGNVKSREEALEANLAAKERLRTLELCWGDDTRCSPDVEAEVLEGLCPPVGLLELIIRGYEGSRYPNWMVGQQNGVLKDLQELNFSGWSQLGPAPEIEAFIHLRWLRFEACSWEALPGNMEALTSLKSLGIVKCLNIRSLPTLPPSLQILYLYKCNDEFMKSCQTVGDPNWQKIEHIPTKKLKDPDDDLITKDEDV